MSKKLNSKNFKIFDKFRQEILFLIRSLLSFLKNIFLYILSYGFQFKGRSILIIQRGNLGDIFLTIPILMELSKLFEINLIVKEQYLSIFTSNQYLSKIKISTVSSKVKTEYLKSRIIFVRGSILDILKIRFKTIFQIIPINTIPVQFSLRYLNKISNDMHSVSLQIGALKKLGIKLDKQSIQESLNIFRQGISRDRVVFNINTGSDLRYLPDDLWVSKVFEYHKLFNSAIDIVGDLSQQSRDLIIKLGLPCVIHDKKSLEDLINILSQAKVFIGPDSGPAHVASYFGAVVHVYYGPDSPSSFGVFSPVIGSTIKFSNYWCSPCYQKYCYAKTKCMSSANLFGD